MKNFIFGALIVTGLAGCAGNSSNTSPLSGTTVADSSRAPKVGSAATPAVAKGNIPVFLTVKSEEVTHDAWVKLGALTLLSAKGEEKVFSPSQGTAIRLAGLRDVEGRRYLYVGTMPREERFVRVRLNLDEKVAVRSLGEEKDAIWELANRGEATLDLNANATFQDALVLELKLNKTEKEAQATIALAPAGDCLKVERQERLFALGTVTAKEKDTTQIAIGNRMVKTVWPNSAEKGSLVAGFLGWDPAAKSTQLNMPMGVTKKDTWVLGKCLAVDEKAKLWTFEPAQGTESWLSSGTLGLPQGIDTLPAAGTAVIVQFVDGKLSAVRELATSPEPSLPDAKRRENPLK